MSAPVYELEREARRAAARSLTKQGHDDPDGETGATRDRIKIRKATATKARNALEALALQLLARRRDPAPGAED